MRGKQTFPREEKLKSRKLIGRIFTEGSVVKAYPIRIQFVFVDESEQVFCQMGVSVPKRNFKSAVDRNRIKRQLREAYRMQKIDLIDRLKSAEKKVAMMVVFAGKEKLPYNIMVSKLNKALQKIRV